MASMPTSPFSMIPFPEWNPAQSLKILVSFNFVDLKFTHHNNAKVSTATFVVFMYCKWTLKHAQTNSSFDQRWKLTSTWDHMERLSFHQFGKNHPHAAIVFFPIPHRWRGEPVKDSSVTGFHRWRGEPVKDSRLVLGVKFPALRFSANSMVTGQNHCPRLLSFIKLSFLGCKSIHFYGTPLESDFSKLIACKLTSNSVRPSAKTS